jgi:4-diphosphocytidyl-2-C-methyl-D-erythritol kinase
MNPTATSDRQPLRLYAPAKVNLRLRVVGRRADGYHLLESILLPVGLCDEIGLTLRTEGGITLALTGDRQGVPDGPENLAWRAAEAFGRAIGRPVPVAIELVKRIPAAAGLGGGSSDAAAVLRGMNEVLGRPFSSDRLAGIGLSLGADVPYFLLGGAAIARGIGERLTPITVGCRSWFVLANPGTAVSTAEVFRLFDFRLTNQEPEDNLPCLIGTGAELCALARNDLTPVAIRMVPEIGGILAFLRDRAPLGAGMSGSGPTVFGVVEDRAQGRTLCAAVARAWPGWRTFLVPLWGGGDWAAGEG